MRPKKHLILYSIGISILFLYTLSNFSYAADPKLVSTLTSAFTKIEGYIVKIATSFAVVAVATGILMRKFSLGDEKKIYRANNLIKGSIISYILIICIDSILSLINNVLV